MDLNHLNLRVKDAVACREFYERFFGFEFAFEADGGFFLRNGDHFLLTLVPADPHQDMPDGFHIGFNLDDGDQVVAKHAELSSAGVTVSDVDDNRGNFDYVTFRCWDPDGTEVEVFWEPAA